MFFQHTPRARGIVAVIAFALVLQPDVLLADKASDEFNLGVGLWRKQRWAPAAEVFVQFLKDYPDHQRVPLAVFYLGSAYSSLQKYGLSRDRFKEFLRLNPESPNAGAALYRIGECSFYLGDHEEAVLQLEKYTREHPRHKLIDWGKLQLGESLIQIGRWAEADVILNKLFVASSSDYIRGQAQYALALSLEKQQNLDAAVDAYRRIAQLDDPRQATRALARAGTIRFRQKRYKLAASLYDQIVTRFPDSRLTPSAALNAGLALYRVSEYQDAIRRFEQVADDSSEKSEATLLTGMSLARLSRLDEARSTLEAVFNAGGDTELAAEALFEMARLEQTAGKHELALRMYSDLLDRWPDDSRRADTVFNAASLQLELKNPSAAERLLEQLKSEFPEQEANPRTMFLTGRILLELNKPIAARESLSQVITADKAGPRSQALSLYYVARIDHEQNLFDSALKIVEQLRPLLDIDANQDLRGALALGALSAIELKKFEIAEELATEYLGAEQDGAQAADARAARTVARASRGNYDGAVRDADKLIETAAQSTQTWSAILQAAELAWDRKEYGAALELFRRANSSMAPEGTRQAGSSGTGWCLFQQQQFSDAGEAFEETARGWPDSPGGLEARHMAARCLQEDGQTDAAIEAYALMSKEFAEKAVREDTPPLQERLWFYSLDAGRTAARLLDSGDRRNESNREWAALAERFKDSKELDTILDEWAWLNLKAGQYSEADAVYRRLLDEVPESTFAGTARLSLAESDLNAERVAAAIREFQAIIEHSQYGESEKAKALYHLIDINAERQAWEQVSEYADRFAAAHSGNPLAPRVQLLHADALLGRQQPDEARRLLELLRRGVLERQLEAVPWTERIWIVLGELALATKDYKRVDEVAEEFFQQFPESQRNFQIKYLQGRRWKNQPEPEFDKARSFFEAAIYDEAGRGTHTAARSQFLIADTRLMEKDYSTATREYFKVATLYPFPELQAQALYQAGLCQQAMGESSEAIQSWKSLVEDFPESPLAKDAVKLIDDETAKSATR